MKVVTENCANFANTWREEPTVFVGANVRQALERNRRHSLALLDNEVWDTAVENRHSMIGVAYPNVRCPPLGARMCLGLYGASKYGLAPFDQSSVCIRHVQPKREHRKVSRMFLGGRDVDAPFAVYIGGHLRPIKHRNRAQVWNRLLHLLSPCSPPSAFAAPVALPVRRIRAASAP